MYIYVCVYIYINIKVAGEFLKKSYLVTKILWKLHNISQYRKELLLLEILLSPWLWAFCKPNYNLHSQQNLLNTVAREPA